MLMVRVGGDLLFWYLRQIEMLECDVLELFVNHVCVKVERQSEYIRLVLVVSGTN